MLANKLHEKSDDWFVQVVSHIEANSIAFGYSDRQYLLGYINKRYSKETAIVIIKRALAESEMFQVNKMSDYLSVEMSVSDYKIYHVLNRNGINVRDFGINIDLKLKHIKDEEELTLPKENSFFLIRSGNQCIEDAKTRPIPKMLFSEFWNEGELSILFADTNVGKSILAVQIANSISLGKAMRGFKCEAQKQKVLYFDFEMSDKQFEKRYSEDYRNHYSWDDNFLRVELNSDFTSYTQFENELFRALEEAVIKHETKILIIDNLTYLKSSSTDTAKEALPLMKLLKELKKKYELSILALAHTPKRNLMNPITKNDLAGSKQLANFADSIYAIGESSKEPSLRYLKQIKARATEIIYDGDNVIVCEIDKPGNFLGFRFIDYGREKEHLREQNDDEKTQLEAKVIELKGSEPTISDAEIGRRVGINRVQVGRILKRAKK